MPDTTPKPPYEGVQMAAPLRDRPFDHLPPAIQDRVLKAQEKK